jgi:hypothetical protein
VKGSAVLRPLLGAVYTAMGAAQLASISQMPAILGAYGLVHGGAAGLLAGAFIAGELLCGLWFLARPGSRAALPVWVYTAVSAGWAALAVQAVARGVPVDNCGCFGRYLPQHLGPVTLAEDALTLLYATVLLRAVYRHRSGS